MAVAVQIEAPRIIVRRTVSSSAAIPKGTVMKLTDENTVEASAANDDPFGGIAVEEKVSTETDVLTIGCAMDGVFDIDSTAAAITAGQMVNIGGANAVLVADEAAWVLGSVVGKAEETRDTDNRVRVRLMGF